MNTLPSRLRVFGTKLWSKNCIQNRYIEICSLDENRAIVDPHSAKEGSLYVVFLFLWRIYQTLYSHSFFRNKNDLILGELWECCLEEMQAHDPTSQLRWRLSEVFSIDFSKLIYGVVKCNILILNGFLTLSSSWIFLQSLSTRSSWLKSSNVFRLFIFLIWKSCRKSWYQSSSCQVHVPVVIFSKSL